MNDVDAILLSLGSFLLGWFGREVGEAFGSRRRATSARKETAD